MQGQMCGLCGEPVGHNALHPDYAVSVAEENSSLLAPNNDVSSMEQGVEF